VQVVLRAFLAVVGERTFHVGFCLGDGTGFSAIGIATETFQSILKSFIRLDLESVSPPDLPEHWEPQITILPANGEG
jgi:hypothetical protein